MFFDMHVHTDISPCSVLPIKDILAHARGLGLDGVCLTDHDTMEARDRVVEGIQDDGLCVIIGMEYTTTEGDFLLFGPYEDLKPGLSAPDLLRHTVQTGGAAVSAHPRRAARPTSEYLIASGQCGIIEVVNGRNRPEENQQARTLSTAYGPHLTGGSDAHTLPELGRVTTRFTRPIANRQDLIDALNAGLCAPGIEMMQMPPAA